MAKEGGYVMRVIIHTMYFLPDFGSAPILMSELASYLAQKGHNVSVITTLPIQKNEIKYKKRIYLEERRDGFLIKRFWTNSGNRPLARLLAWNFYIFWTVLNIARIQKGDILFLRLPPLQLGLTGILAKRLKGTKIIVNVQDIHPDLVIESGNLKNPFIIKIAKYFEKWVYRNSDILVVISEGFKKNLEDKGVNPEKTKVIPNWVDTDFLKPLPKNNSIAKKFSLDNKFVIMYSGTITVSGFLSLERVLDVAYLLKEERDILFVVVGEGLKKQSLQEKADKLALRNVMFLPFQPYSEVPYLLASADVLIVPLDESKSSLSVPSKLYSCMAARKPILGLADSSSEVAKIIIDANCGVCVQPHDIEGIVKAITELKKFHDYRETLSMNARKYAVENFSKNRILQIYETLISSL